MRRRERNPNLNPNFDPKQVPFNETPEACGPEGPDRWYKLEPSSETASKYYTPGKILTPRSIQILGNIFTTRMPRLTDYQKVNGTSVTFSSPDGGDLPLTSALVEKIRDLRHKSNRYSN